ncbi:ribonuclease T2 [Punctularia strigosozonata HHB-11173 SS5]|uniref:ribonuclease T2 n=1 Tax=Punctularia strigosozonata (strain HHB-11173) TaxID=741275 RepID=UPI0004417FA7|nr:ribonuclease T2 [Punctularia strigosozonata HHB-11173 SS5]EIN13900.1 ribonuclease T2 [Punctularia strigosozonata HHB-11173 SS5]
MLAASLVLGALAAPSLAFPLFSSYEPFELFKRISSGCSTTGTASCHNSTVVKDTCCFEANGLLLQTQYWDFDPASGPDDSWTIHGLWPDYCDGTYPASCDSSRAYTDISGLLTDQGASDTLDYMETYWVQPAKFGTDESFWEHEWAKHGTCMTTLETSCLPSGSSKGAEAVAFFKTVVKLFKKLPTYDWLANQGITPDSDKTYTLKELTSALEAESGGFTPALDCDSGNLNMISWYFNLKGSVIDGKFVAIDAPEAGSCPSSGIKYPPKSGSSSSSTTTTKTSTKTSTSTTSTATATGLPTKATLVASSSGGLLSGGTWSTQTLATYTISGSADSFTMKTSKGSCGVSSGALKCGSGVSSSSFSAVSSGSKLLLAYDGSTKWSSDDTPSGSDQETVYTGSSHDESFKISIHST